MRRNRGRARRSERAFRIVGGRRSGNFTVVFAFSHVRGFVSHSLSFRLQISCAQLIWRRNDRLWLTNPRTWLNAKTTVKFPDLLPPTIRNARSLRRARPRLRRIHRFIPASSMNINSVLMSSYINHCEYSLLFSFVLWLFLSSGESSKVFMTISGAFSSTERRSWNSPLIGKPRT